MRTVSCAECGLDYEAMPPAEAIAAIRGFTRRYRAPFTRLLRGEDESVLRTRPAPETWSALEYGAHVRDVFARYADWVGRILAEDRPVLEGPLIDDPSIVRGYNDEAPAEVVEGVATQAERLAAVFEAVPDGAWDRVGIRRGQPRSVVSFARNAVHEGSHHLLDIGRGLRAARGAGPPEANATPAG